MKRFFITTAITLMCAGVCIAATYTIKPSANKTTTTTNYYNNYTPSQYVTNNTVNNSNSSVVELVMDFSGSMYDAVEVAKNTMASVVSQIPPNIQVGFRVFGQGRTAPKNKIGKVQTVTKAVNEKGKTVYKLQTGQHQSNQESSSGCKATQLVTPITQANAYALISGMNSVSLGGSTPMVYALRETVDKDLSKFSRNIPKKIVLITDGGENCGGDPCAFARTLMATRRDIQIDVVLVSSSSNEIKCLAATTGGAVYNLSSANQLTQALKHAIKTPINTQRMPNNPEVEEEIPPAQQYEFLDE